MSEQASLSSNKTVEQNKQIKFDHQRSPVEQVSALKFRSLREKRQFCVALYSLFYKTFWELNEEEGEEKLECIARSFAHSLIRSFARSLVRSQRIAL